MSSRLPFDKLIHTQHSVYNIACPNEVKEFIVKNNLSSEIDVQSYICVRSVKSRDLER